MQLDAIRENVQYVLQDEDFTDDMINQFINDVYLSVAASCLIPSLKTMDVVNTVVGKSFTNITGNGFSSNISRAFDGSGNTLLVVSDLEDLMDLSGNQIVDGDVEVIALEGNVLWYHPVPSTSQAITIIYYTLPDLLVEDEDTPDAIPAFLHERILVNGALALCYDKIEADVNGARPNMAFREGLKNDGIVKLKEWLGKTRNHYVKPGRLDG